MFSHLLEPQPLLLLVLILVMLFIIHQVLECRLPVIVCVFTWNFIRILLEIHFEIFTKLTMIAHRPEVAEILQQKLRIDVQVHVVVVDGAVKEIGKLSIVHSLTVLGAAVDFGEGIEAAREEARIVVEEAEF